ncbi:sialate O-acetylesterase [Stratiformator vulcanicus]|nr:sialate O-acetylesterase [Stratiformator vulcanicus]
MMKLLLAAVLCVWTSQLARADEVVQAGEPAGPHLFILSGQSNMKRLMPEQNFTPAIKEKLGENTVVVHSAVGGKPIRMWVHDWKSADGKQKENQGDLYDAMMREVRAAMKDEPPASTVTFIWIQGERDAKEGHGDVYERSLGQLLSQLRRDLKRDDITFVIGRLHKFENNLKDWEKIREAQVSYAESEPAAVWVDRDDIDPKRKNIHHSRKGYDILGKRLADTAAEIVQGKVADSSQ